MLVQAGALVKGRHSGQDAYCILDTKQHVNKKKTIKSKSRPSIYVSLNSNNLIFLPKLNSKKLN